MVLDELRSPLEKEGQNFIWYGVSKNKSLIYECDDQWNTKDFMDDIYGPRYFLDGIGLIGKGKAYNLSFNIQNKKDITKNMFSILTTGNKEHKYLPNIFITSSLYETTEVKSLTSPTIKVDNIRDDIFVRKYISADISFKKQMTQSSIDYYALGYSNKVELDKTNIHYALMLCVPNNKDKGIFYKIQFTPEKDIDIDLYTCNGIFYATDIHKHISLKKGTREEFNYRLE